MLPDKVSCSVRSSVVSPYSTLSFNPFQYSYSDTVEITLPWESGKTDGVDYENSSFKQQLDFLLTSRERLQLKKALQIYAERR